MKNMVFLVLFFINGCINLPLKEEKPTRVVVLNACETPPSIKKYIDKELYIHKPLMPEWLNSHRLFLKHNHLVTPLAHIEWAEKAADHMYANLRRYFNDSGLFKGVSFAYNDCDYVLKTYIEAFWIEKNEQGYKAKVHITLKLYDPFKKIRYQDSYCVQKKCDQWQYEKILNSLEKAFYESLDYFLCKIQEKL